MELIKQKGSIEIDSEVYSELVNYVETNEKYGNTILLNALMDRIISQWYIRALPQWLKRPELVPKLTGKEPTNKNAIEINREHLNKFKTYCESLNYNPSELATWLTKTFIKGWKLQQRTNKLKKSMFMR